MKSSVRWTHIALHADFTNGPWRLLILKGTCLLSWAQFHWQFPWGAVFAVRETRVWKSRASETRAVELYAESVQNSSATWEWFSKGWKYSWRTVYSARTDEVLWKKPRINRLEYVRFPLSSFSLMETTILELSCERAILQLIGWACDRLRLTIRLQTFPSSWIKHRRN